MLGLGLNLMDVSLRGAFNPASILGDQGQPLLKQQLLTGTPIPLSGEIIDENTNAGDARPLQVGKAYDFDAVNDYVSVVNTDTAPSILQGLANDIVFEVDVIPDVVTGTISTTWANPLTFIEFRTEQGSGTKTPFNFGIYNSKFAFACTSNHTGGGFRALSTATLVAGQHYTLKAIISGNTYELYIDGILDSSGAITNATGDRSVGTTNANLFVGARSTNTGAPSAFYNGKMWNLKIGTSSETLLHYKMDEGNGIVAIDSSGNGNHGSIEDATLSSFHATQDVISYQNDVGYSPALNFDGTQKITYPVISGNWDDIEFDVYLLDEVTSDTAFSTLASMDGGNVPVICLGNLTGGLVGETLTIGTSAVVSTYLTQSIPAGYHKIRMSWNGARYAVYIDGVEATTSSGSASHHPRFSDVSLTIGGRPAAGTFNGILRKFVIKDNGVEIFNAPLSNHINDIEGGLSGSAFTAESYVYIPAATDTMDAFGEDLIYRGQVLYNGQARGANCGTFDGISSNLNTGIPANFSNDYVLYADIVPISTSGTNSGAYRVVQTTSGATSTRHGLAIDNNKIVMLYNNGSFTISPGISVSAGDHVRCCIRRSGNLLQLYADGVLIDSISASILNANADRNILFGAIGIIRGFDGQIFNCQVYDTGLTQEACERLTSTGIAEDGLLEHFPLSEGSGSSAFGVNGAIGSIDNATLSTFWGGSQDFYHYNLANGFTYAYQQAEFAIDPLATSYSFKVRTNQTQVLFFDDFATNGNYIGVVCHSSQSSEGLLNATGITIDGVAPPDTNRDTLSSLICDGYEHEVVVTGMDFTGWTKFNLEYTSVWTLNDGGVWDIKIGGVSPEVTSVTRDVRLPSTNELTNPAGSWHNRAESHIDFTGGVLTPDAVQGSWVDDWAFNDAEVNPRFHRTIEQDGTEVGADRFLAYKDTLAGKDLINVLKWVGVITLVWADPEIWNDTATWIG